MPPTRFQPVPAALLVAVVLAAGCSQPVEKADPPRPAKVMTVRPSGGADLSLYAGEVRPRYEMDLSFRIGGKILARTVELGSRVARGQPVARLDPQDAKLSAAAAAAQVAVTEADLAFARAELERNRQLLQQKFISQAAYDNKQAAWEAAVARRQAASAQAEVSGNQAGYTTLVADTAGVITAGLAEAGQVVSAGQPVARLARTEERDVVINVAESQAAGLRAGTPAQISLWSRPDRVYAGRVREVAPAADAATRTYLVKIAVQDPDEGLRWGMTANVAVAGMRASTLPAGAMVVPLPALGQQGAQAVVWVVDAGNKVRQQPVAVAQFLENGALLAGGLQGGETIVVAGVHKLIPGEVIRPVVAEAGGVPTPARP